MGFFPEEELSGMRRPVRSRGSDPRYARIISYFYDRYEMRRGVAPDCDASDFRQVSRMLKRNPKLKASQLCLSIHRYLNSEDPFHRDQGHPLRWWATHLNTFLRPRSTGRKKGPQNLDQRIAAFLSDPTPDMDKGLRRDVGRAVGLFGGPGGHKYLDLAEEVGRRQRKMGWRLLLALGTGQLSLCREYLDWIEDQSWIKHKSPKLLDIEGRLFQRFREQWSRNDSLGRDPLTGEESV